MTSRFAPLGASTLTRHASPNENCQVYFERALVILADLDAADHAVAQLQATPRGLLRVNAPMSFGTLQLGPAVADFMALYPELRIHLVLSDEQIDPVQGGYDVTLRIADLESSSLIARKILAIDRAICAAPDYLEQHGTRLRLFGEERLVIAVPPDHLRRRVKGSPYLYWRGALRYSKYRIQEGSSAG